jgi:uncharacterized protein YpuA (DUF1002 family)
MEYTISIKWGDDDVRHQASQMGVTLTDEQIINVLNLVKNNHDADYGVTWDTIEWAIESELRPAK